MAEQRAHNASVAGSSPARSTQLDKVFPYVAARADRYVGGPSDKRSARHIYCKKPLMLVRSGNVGNQLISPKTCGQWAWKQPSDNELRCGSVL